MASRGVPRGALLVGVVVCLAALVGGYVVFFGGGGSPSPEPIGENASARYAAVDGFGARMTVIREIGDTRNRSTYRIKRRPGEPYYYRRALSNRSNDPELVVVNPSTLWTYDRETNTAERTNITGMDRFDSSLGKRLDPLFAKINAQRGVEGVETPTPGVAPVPVVPSGSAPTPAPNATNASTGYNVTYLGTTRVAGRKTYHVRIHGNLFADEVTSNFTQEIWFDSEHFVPLKYVYIWTNDGRRNRVTVRYANVTFDPGLSASTFRFDPETDVQTAEPTVLRRRTYHSRRGVVRAARTTVPDPAVPGRFELEYATYQNRDPREVVLRYRNDSSFVLVTKSQDPEIDFPAAPERITFRNRTARYAEFGPNGESRLLAWQCEDYEYAVATRKLPRARHFAIARSVGCS